MADDRDYDRHCSGCGAPPDQWCLLSCPRFQPRGQLCRCYCLRPCPCCEQGHVCEASALLERLVDATWPPSAADGDPVSVYNDIRAFVEARRG